jgi:L-lactate dehydrogenase (cytochrome)
VRRLIERARAAECSALVLTVDLAAQAQRHQDVRNGLSVPPRLTLGHALNMASKPRWCWQMLRSPGRSFGNLEGFVTGSQGAQSLGQWIGSQFDASLSWRDVAWVRDLWPGKLVIKGLLDAEDAALAVVHGADAIVVSNHGGRQLDGTVSTMAALPGVVAEVGARCEVWVDGGIRSGQDVLKALALGARGTLIGRAFLHGLAAHGQAGVTTALTLIQRELDVSMALCGLRSVREVGPQALWAQAS